MYVELTPQDTIRDLQRLLIDVIPGFEFPRKDLYNYNINVAVVPQDEVLQGDFIIGTLWAEVLDEYDPSAPPKVLVERSSFAEELTAEEQNILAILMMEAWVQRQVTSIENTRMKYSGTDFKMTSQANHLAKLQALLKECQRQSHHMQRLYKRRQFNKEGRYESTWGWFGEQH